MYFPGFFRVVFNLYFVKFLLKISFSQWTATQSTHLIKVTCKLRKQKVTYTKICTNLSKAVRPYVKIIL